MGYVYRHIRLDSGNPFYIGISNSCDNRYKRANAKTKRNNLWAKIIAKTNYEVEILFEHDNYELIKEKEKEFISLYGRINTNTGILSNLTDGGEGTIGWIPTKEQRRNQSNRMKGDKHPQFGIEHSKERRLNNSLGQLNLNKNNNVLSEINKKNKGALSSVSIKVINIKTNEIFDTLTDAAKSIGFSQNYLGEMLRGKYLNKTDIRFL
jgi:hypothetical protein